MLLTVQAGRAYDQTATQAAHHTGNTFDNLSQQAERAYDQTAETASRAYDQVWALFSRNPCCTGMTPMTVVICQDSPA